MAKHHLDGIFWKLQPQRTQGPTAAAGGPDWDRKQARADGNAHTRRAKQAARLAQHECLAWTARKLRGLPTTDTRQCPTPGRWLWARVGAHARHGWIGALKVTTGDSACLRAVLQKKTFNTSSTAASSSQTVKRKRNVNIRRTKVYAS